MQAIDTIVQVLAYAALAGAIYGGIRADLKAMHERVDRLSKNTVHAHRRIDDLLMDQYHRHHAGEEKGT